MRAYAYVVPTFWTRGSGKRLRGNPAAQALALYVMTAPASNMIGLYYAPATTIAAETGISLADLPRVFEYISEIAKYDFENEIVWVPEGAAHQIGDELKGGDKRRKQVLRELESMGSHPFVEEFLTRYSDCYGLDLLRSASQTKGHIENQEGASAHADGTLPCPVPDPDPDPAGERSSSHVSAMVPVSRPEPVVKVRRKSPETPIPEPFPITDAHRAHAAKKGWPSWWFAIAFESFCGKAKAKDWRYVAWDQALYNFVSAEIGYKRGPAELAHMAPSGSAAPASNADEVARRRASAAAAEARAEAQRLARSSGAAKLAIEAHSAGNGHS